MGTQPAHHNRRVQPYRAIVPRAPYPPPSMRSPKPRPQIRWSSFANRKPSSVNELWPPYNFRLRKSDVTEASSEWVSTAPSSSIRDTRESSVSQGTTLVSDIHRESMRTRSLRRFVEAEYGLGAIHIGTSEVAMHQQALDLEGWESGNFVTRTVVADLTSSETCDVDNEAVSEEDQRELGVGRKRKWSFSSSICRLFHLEEEDAERERGELKRKLSAKGKRVVRSVKKNLGRLRG